MNAIQITSPDMQRARVRAAVRTWSEGAVLELPSTTLREQIENPQKVIVWPTPEGVVRLRTWSESKSKEQGRWTLDQDGRLLDNGVLTMWWAFDLRLTGENVMQSLLDAIEDLPDDDDLDETPSARIIPFRPGTSRAR